MRAWDSFRARSPESPLRLVVVGGGEMSTAVANWATRHPSVTMAGHVSRPEVSRILAASRAVVVPSQWEETFGMVAVEAMAAGTAAVASAHGAFPELITHGSDGALFPAYRHQCPGRHLGGHRRQPAAMGGVRSASTPDLPQPFQR